MTEPADLAVIKDPTRAIYILALNNFATGGAELLHQLGAELIRQGRRAFMLYFPLSKPGVCHPNYSAYQVPIARFSEIEHSSIVVIPEAHPEFVNRFHGHHVLFWWLSVDFYPANLSKWQLFRSRRLMPWQTIDFRKKRYRERIALHLTQSEYARTNLAGKGIHNSLMLDDYLNVIYLNESMRPDYPRENIVAYNPKKGLAETEQILPLIGNGTAVALENMSRDDIVNLLSRAKVYIDFGNHPGKDRFPREAASLGACVITNRRGSAANMIDVPIPDKYKIDDQVPDFAQQAAVLIQHIFADFAAHSTDFDPYRHSIAQEPHGFREKVAKIFAPNGA